MLSVISLMCFVLATPTLADAATAKRPALHAGDLIFHLSQGFQANAILEATGSAWSHVGILFDDGAGGWIVAEASAPVRVVSLQSFINRGKGKDYRIYRARDFKSTDIQSLRAAVDSEIGKRYDIYFEWSDDAIYCSELVYKAFDKASGIKLGAVQKFSDLKLDGPYVKALIQNRLTETGRQLNLNEPIVTPINQMKDNDLDLIYRSGR